MIVLIGESASGKSTIEKELVIKGYKKIISYTTRPIRNGEKNGVDYHFISVDEFFGKINKGFFAEYTKYRDWHYGAAKEDCKDDTVIVVDPHGFRQLMKIDGLDITSFYIKVDEKERVVRMIKRGDDITEVFRRIISDRDNFQGIENEVDHVIDNCGLCSLNYITSEILDLDKVKPKKKKQKLFIDFDGCVTNSIKSFCDVYNDIYNLSIASANYLNVNKWDFSDECPLLNGDKDLISNIFSSKRFFEELEFLNGNTYEILKELNENYDITIVTIGSPLNIQLKSKWIQKNLPFIEKCIFISDEECKMDKSMINMEGAIFVDDVKSNLDSTNATSKICFGDTYEWNEDWNRVRCVNWTDLKTSPTIVLQFNNIKEVISQ